MTIRTLTFVSTTFIRTGPYPMAGSSDRRRRLKKTVFLTECAWTRMETYMWLGRAAFGYGARQVSTWERSWGRSSRRTLRGVTQVIPRFTLQRELRYIEFPPKLMGLSRINDFQVGLISMNGAKMKRLVSFFVCVLLGAFAVSWSTTAAAQNGSRQIIQPAGASGNFPFSPGILVDGTLYVAGQGSANAQGVSPADFPGKVKQSLENVRSVLQAAGMDFGNVVWMNVYLTHANDIDAMNDVYWKEIGANPPARSVMVIGNLVGGDSVEINCIAVKDKAHRRAIWPRGWPRGPQTDPPAIQANDVLYLSAQNGANPKTGKLADSFTAETRQALDN